MAIQDSEYWSDQVRGQLSAPARLRGPILSRLPLGGFGSGFNLTSAGSITFHRTAVNTASESLMGHV
jgi:hypothetical protein